MNKTRKQKWPKFKCKMVLILTFYNCENSATRRCAEGKIYMCVCVYVHVYTHTWSTNVTNMEWIMWKMKDKRLGINL